MRCLLSLIHICKYFFQLSYRRDASSRFHPDNRWGNFYSVGTAWILTKEKWLDDIKWLDLLKLKFSVGQQGNISSHGPADTPVCHPPVCPPCTASPNKKPADTDAEHWLQDVYKRQGRTNLIRRTLATLYHTGQFIQIRILRTP